ncbi:MAG: dockerin type I domain-containing protein, partial [SAR202 cluster bacterium]|nr:dockerin type I domain-containing protein [SAR202 cluster bacterium]
ETGLQIKPILTSLNTPIKNQADNGTGRIEFASGTFVTPYPTGAFLVAEITFVGIEAGPPPTEIRLSFEPGRITTASVTGSVVAGNHENAQVLLTDVKLVGIVQLEGGDRPTPEGWEVPITVKFFVPGMDTPLRTCNTSTVKVAEGAMFECSAVSGFFDLTVDSVHVLANIKRRVELPNPGASNRIDFGVLLEGDANDDGVVDVRDFTLLVDGFGACLPITTYATNIDFDRNGCVNILDFTLLSKNFLKREPVPVP